MDRFWAWAGGAFFWGVAISFILAAIGHHNQDPSSTAFIPLLIAAAVLLPPVRRLAAGYLPPVRTMFIVLGAFIAFGIMSGEDKSQPKGAQAIANETPKNAEAEAIVTDETRTGTEAPGSAKICFTDSDINLGSVGAIELPASTVFRDSGAFSGNKENPATWDDDHAHSIGAGSAIITLTPVILSDKQRCSEAKVKMFLGPLYNTRRASVSDDHVFSIEDVLDYPVPAQKPRVEIGKLIDDISVRAILLTDVSESFVANTASADDEEAKKAECLDGAQKLAVHMHAALGRQTHSMVEIANAPVSGVSYGRAFGKFGPDLFVAWEKSAKPSAATVSFIASAGEFLTGASASELKQELTACVTEALKPKSGELANREFRGAKMECQAFSRDGGAGSVTIYRRFGAYPLRPSLSESERAALTRASEAVKAKEEAEAAKSLDFAKWWLDPEIPQKVKAAIMINARMLALAERCPTWKLNWSRILKNAASADIQASDLQPGGKYFSLLIGMMVAMRAGAAEESIETACDAARKYDGD